MAMSGKHSTIIRPRGRHLLGPDLCCVALLQHIAHRYQILSLSWRSLAFVGDRESVFDVILYSVPLTFGGTYMIRAAGSKFPAASFLAMFLSKFV